MSFLRWLFCRHPRMFFVRNIYGDEINQCGGNRSLWHCPDCKMYQYHPELNGRGNVLKPYDEGSL